MKLFKKKGRKEMQGQNEAGVVEVPSGPGRAEKVANGSPPGRLAGRLSLLKNTKDLG